MSTNEHPRTIDDVVAENLRRLRNQRRMTRVQLAEHLTNRTGTEWSRWRIVDLEGARSKSRPPRPATWADLVALAFVLEVRIPELVLPDEGTEMVAAEPRFPVEIPDRPDVDDVTLVDRVYINREEAAIALFGLDAQYLFDDRGREEMARLGAGFTTAQYEALSGEIADLRQQILDTLERFANTEIMRTPGPIVTIETPPFDNEEST